METPSCATLLTTHIWKHCLAQQHTCMETWPCATLSTTHMKTMPCTTTQWKHCPAQQEHMHGNTVLHNNTHGNTSLHNYTHGNTPYTTLSTAHMLGNTALCNYQQHTWKHLCAQTLSTTHMETPLCTTLLTTHMETLPCTTLKKKLHRNAWKTLCYANSHLHAHNTIISIRGTSSLALNRSIEDLITLNWYASKY